MTELMDRDRTIVTHCLIVMQCNAMMQCYIAICNLWIADRGERRVRRPTPAGRVQGGTPAHAPPALAPGRQRAAAFVDSVHVRDGDGGGRGRGPSCAEDGALGTCSPGGMHRSLQRTCAPAQIRAWCVLPSFPSPFALSPSSLSPTHRHRHTVCLTTT